MNQPKKIEGNIDSQIIQLKPVGFVNNKSKDPSWSEKFSTLSWQERAARMKEQRESISELVIDTSLDGILNGIDGFSHLIVLYWAHRIPQGRRSTTQVHPLGNKDFPLVGVFATRSPIRPNTILSTTVSLVERVENVLKVTGLDALDGSPILDIKPYIPDHYASDGIRVPAWMETIHDEFNEE